MQESSFANLYFNGIFYLNFCKELLILIEANFSNFYHRFLLRFVKKFSSQKTLPTTKACAITLT